MKIGLRVNSFSWPQSPAEVGPTLCRIAPSADEVGFAKLSAMDHV